MTPSGVMWRVSPVQYWRAALDVSPSQKAGAHVHVATTHFLKTLIANVSGEGESPASVVGNSIKDTTRKERRSAVAIVMRVVQQRKKQQSAMEPVSSPVHPVIQNSSGEVELSSRNRSLDAILEHASGLEILFISRTLYKAQGESTSKRSQDARRWSGQVAFPGGKQQSGETDLETAMRECAEETGLDLGSSAFTLLGQLPSRMATPTLSIAPFVFLQLDNPGPEEGRQQTRGEGPDRPRLQLDNSEVAAAWWVPVQVLATRAAVKTLCLDLRLMGVGAGPAALCRTAGAQAVHFPCVILPTPPPHCVTQPVQGQQTVLWGLTLGIVADLLEAGDIVQAGGELPRPSRTMSEARLGDMDGETGVLTKLFEVSGLNFWKVRTLMSSLTSLRWSSAASSST